MTVETSYLTINREGEAHSAKFSDLASVCRPNDLFLLQRGEVLFQVAFSSIQANKGIIRDDDFLVVTDEDGVTYKITGMSFKTALGDDLVSDFNGILTLISGTLKIQGGLPGGSGEIQRPDGITEAVGSSFSKAYSVPGEYILPVDKMNRLSFTGSTTADFKFNPGFDVSSIENMAKMFQQCYVFNSDISTWDTSRATNMYSMFQQALEFDTYLGNWDTSNVTSMSRAFYDARKFNQNINGWDVKEVKDFSYMFYNCRLFDNSLGDWVVSNATKMDHMFNQAYLFNQDLRRWPTSNVSNMYGMFRNAKVFNQDISTWCVTKIRSKPSGFDTSSGFYNKPVIQPTWSKCAPVQINDVKIEMSDGGLGPAKFDEEVVISESGSAEGGWTPQNQWQFESPIGSGTFEDIDGETDETLTIVSFYQSRNVRLKQSFGEATTGLLVIYSNEIFVTNEDMPVPIAVGVTYTTGTLRIIGSKTTAGHIYHVDKDQLIPIGPGSFNKSFSQTNSGMYLIESHDLTALNFKGSSSNSDLQLDPRSYMDSLVDVSNMFYGLREFNQNLSWWDTENVTNMSGMFMQCYKFNGEISNWNVSNVENMAGMFSSSSVFNQNLESWDIRASNASNMFLSAREFSSNLNPTWPEKANITGMFGSAEKFNGDLSGWDVSGIESFYKTFSGAKSFSSDVSQWSVSNSNNMTNMFVYATSFEADISVWCVPLISKEPSYFAKYGSLPEENYPQWGKCPPPGVSNPVIS